MSWRYKPTVDWTDEDERQCLVNIARVSKGTTAVLMVVVFLAGVIAGLFVVLVAGEMLQ